MNNKTINLYLWNLPLECTDIIIGKLRNLASSSILNGEDEMAENLMRCIRDAEIQLQERTKEVNADDLD